MNIKQQFCFSDVKGNDVFLFTLRNSSGTKVCITNYGAIITSFIIHKEHEGDTDIVLGFDQVNDYLDPDYLKDYPWMGCVVGRYANRIKDGKFVIGNQHYQLSKNKGTNHLHGGFEGFDRKTWKLVEKGVSPQPFLVLAYRSPDGEEGYPGNLDVQIRYELNENNEFSYQFTAICDQPTAINLTHHSYFNLNGGSGTINDHILQLAASNILEQDADLVATGVVKPVAGTAHDFRQFKKIAEGHAVVNEFDQSFVIDGWPHHNKNNEPVLIAEIRSAASTIKMQLLSDSPVVHFYSGKWIPVIKGKNGISYGPFSGLCLETQHHPNAINIATFPATLLQPGEVYSQRTIYKITD